MSERGLEGGNKRRFLALEQHGWALPAAVLGSASGEAPSRPIPPRPVPSRRVRRPEERGPAGPLGLQRAGSTGSKVTVFQNRVSIRVRFAPEGSQEMPGLVFVHAWWVPATSSMRACTCAHTHNQHTHNTHRGERYRRPGLYFVLFSGL